MINKLAFFLIFALSLLIIIGCEQEVPELRTPLEQDSYTLTVFHPREELFTQQYGGVLKAKYPHIQLEVLTNELMRREELSFEAFMDKYNLHSRNL